MFNVLDLKNKISKMWAYVSAFEIHLQCQSDNIENFFYI